MLGPGIDREADADAAEAHGVPDAARERLRGVALLEQHVVAAELQDQRHPARELARPRLEEAEGRGVGVAPRLDRELEVVARVVRWRGHPEGPSRPGPATPGPPRG